jgi:hypothetical protein
MTIFAGIARQNMINVFADRIRTVVTAEAIAREIGVIKIRGQPPGRCMAIVAIIATRYVRRVLSFCD